MFLKHSNVFLHSREVKSKAIRTLLFPENASSNFYISSLMFPSEITCIQIMKEGMECLLT